MANPRNRPPGYYTYNVADGMDPAPKQPNFFKRFWQWLIRKSKA